MPDPTLLAALAALLEVADAAREGPVRPTLVLRSLLAMIYERSDGDVRPYHAFWSIVRSPDYTGPQPGYLRATNARTEWCRIARTLGLEPQSSALHDRLAELIAQQREMVDPEYRAVRQAARALRQAKYDREIISTKDHPHSEAGQQLMAERIARGEEPA